jgi:L-seryl-tRNA(Ser) seleniumtransferase
MSDARRALPSVHALVDDELLRPLLEHAPRTLVTDAVRTAIDRARRDPSAAPTDRAGWVDAVKGALADLERPSLRPVYNATGIVLHTNLGRAPLPRAALAAIQETAATYNNLEYDVDRGERGSRYDHCVALLRELTGAEDALVVNNCAAALVLTLNTLADQREAIVSRGELIEIGGSFRVPDIMAKSGAQLVEVGTTNRTYVTDYAAARSDRTAAVVKVHRSNFAIEGFVAEASLDELSAWCRAEGVALIHDFGSGLMVRLEDYGLTGEPTALDAVRAGAHVVVMSGDKLLGGPQAGLVVGDSAIIRQCRKNPLLRALRVDKMTIAALEATLRLYQDPTTVIARVPALAMLTAPEATVRARAIQLADQLRARGVGCEVVSTIASVGGGAFPTARIASAAVALDADASRTESRLRMAPRPIVGRIADGRLVLDLRSVAPADDEGLCETLVAALA